MPYICDVYEVQIKCLHVNTAYLEFESMYFVLVLAKIPWLLFVQYCLYNLECPGMD